MCTAAITLSYKIYVPPSKYIATIIIVQLYHVSLLVMLFNYIWLTEIFNFIFILYSQNFYYCLVYMTSKNSIINILLKACQKNVLKIARKLKTKVSLYIFTIILLFY